MSTGVYDDEEIARAAVRRRYGLSPGGTAGPDLPRFWERWGGILMVLASVVLAASVIYGDVRVLRSQVDDLREDMRQIKVLLVAKP